MSTATTPGWLDKLTQWLKDVIGKAVDAIADIVGDAVVLLIEGVLKLVTVIVDAIPVPDFLSQYTVCGLLSQAGPTATWVMGVMKLPEGMAIVTAAIGFRLLRKLLTLFQW